MRNIGTLYKFELRKLLRRKMLWISLAFMMIAVALLSVFQVAGNVYVSNDVTGQDLKVWSHYDMIQLARTDPAGLSGRLLDTELIHEAIDSLGIVRPRMVLSLGDNVEQAITVVEPTDHSITDFTMKDQTLREQWWDVHRAVEALVGEERMDFDITGDDFYEALELARTAAYGYAYLRPAEIDWWQAKAEQLQTPFTWSGYSKGWDTIVSSSYVVNILGLLFATIALAGVFPMERQQRMDQLSMCAKCGEGALYTAKLLTGLTVSFAGMLALWAALAVPSLILMGPEGVNTAVQQIADVTYAIPMTVGALALICFGLCLAASLFYAVLTLLVSLLVRGGMPTMATLFGFMLLTMSVAVPAKFRVLSQLYDMLPTVMDVNGILDVRLTHVFGGYLRSFQAAPVMWMMLTAAMAAGGFLLHKKVPNK